MLPVLKQEYPTGKNYNNITTIDAMAPYDTRSFAAKILAM